MPNSLPKDGELGIQKPKEDLDLDSLIVEINLIRVELSTRWMYILPKPWKMKQEGCGITLEGGWGQLPLVFL